MDIIITLLEEYFDTHEDQEFGTKQYKIILEEEYIKSLFDEYFHDKKRVYEEEYYGLSSNVHVMNVIDLYLEMHGIKKKNTNDMNSDMLSHEQDYYNSIRNYRVLTTEEVKQYFTEYRNGSNEAFNILFKHNLRFAYFEAKRFARKSKNYNTYIMDLIQESNLALITAIEKYDLSKDVKFSYYASFWTRQRMARYMQEKYKTIKIPSNIEELLVKMRKYAKEYHDKYNISINFNKMSLEELAQLFNTSMNEIEYALNIPEVIISLNKKVKDKTSEENDTEFVDFIDSDMDTPSDIVTESIFYEEVLEAFNNSRLTDMEKRVIERRMGLNGFRSRTLAEIGREFNRTREAIRIAERNALRKLRQDRKMRELARSDLRI